jgi:SAM-dependent methyltransferase
MDHAADGSTEAARHYDTLLAKHYTWMAGGFRAKTDEQKALLESLGIGPAASARAADLGCGSGFQAVALAELGFTVTALDLSAELLAELDGAKGSLPIETHRADLRDARTVVEPGIELAVCMGDTLTHLPSKDAVATLFADIRSLLAPGGALVLSYRDLSAELTGTDRFLPVRADDDRIMTCFLEYEPETVVVHDLVHTREAAGWTLHKSRYRKLRLPIAWVKEQLETAGLTVRRVETVARMAVIVAGLTPP